LSRCNSKLRIISLKDVPLVASAGLNRQPHSEQPNPENAAAQSILAFAVWPSMGVQGTHKVYMRHFDWSVGHPT